MLYIKKVCGYVIQGTDAFMDEKGALDSFNPQTIQSKRFKCWVNYSGGRICEKCEDYEGEIYYMDEKLEPEPPIHINCRCEIVPMQAIIAGGATNDGDNGADWWLKNLGVLPKYYITAEELEKLGWNYGDRPSKYAPGRMLTCGVYSDKNNHLPQKSGRIWYEADINYTPGRRNRHRVVWSNDGLIFVTYDHYETFYEIV